MTSRAKVPSRSLAAGSWLALLAATTIGDAAATLRAEVRAKGLTEGAAYRLVVQSYDASDGPLPGHDARPIGSVQRVVTADELRQGVRVDLLELRHGATDSATQEPVVLAWIEVGVSALEFDGRAARPAPGSMYGVVRRTSRQDLVHIRLDRKLTG